VWSSENAGIRPLRRIIAFEARRITSELELVNSLSVRSNAEGYLVVVTPGADLKLGESIVSSAAGLLGLSDSNLKSVFNIHAATPVARLRSIEETDRLRTQLKLFQIESITVPEHLLQLNRNSRQMRALILTDESVTGVGSGNNRVRSSWDKIRLIVQGRLFSQRTETEEHKRGRRMRLVEKREMSSDDSVLDIYAANDEVNWRIRGSNFDFSCLGAAKRSTAFENFTLLVQLLRDRIAAPFDDAYVQSRQLLNVVWPLENRITKQHGNRTRVRKFDLATITTTENEGQFTRYSRLRHHLICQETMSAA
jgi:hypothetical protein